MKSFKHTVYSDSQWSGFSINLLHYITFLFSNF